LPIKNFTTSIKIEKTISEIELILTRHGATHIFKMYSNDGVPIALAFKCLIKNDLISFKLPMEEQKVLQVFKNGVHNGELPKRYWDDLDQARRTGWRIIKDWISSQMALIEINIVKFEEIFLPYMYNENLGKTMFELLEEKDFRTQLDYHKKDENEKVNEEWKNNKLCG